MNRFVEFQNVCLRFGEVEVLKNVSFELYPGEVCTIMGENGSGKSSMMKILSGAYIKDSGRILVDGEEQALGTVYNAQKLGIHMIYHETQLLDDFSVQDNIFLGHEIVHPDVPFVYRTRQFNTAKQVLDFLGRDIDPNALVSSLNHLEKRIVEIAKAIVLGVRVLILDEVTAFFSDDDKDAIFAPVNKLKELGVAVVFISHRMEHIQEISDRIIVMRGGEIVQKCLVEDGHINPGAMVSHILGLNAAAETLFAMEKPDGAKKVCYNELDLPLIAIADLEELGKTNALYRALAEIVKKNGGLWCAEAERYLLEHAPRL